MITHSKVFEDYCRIANDLREVFQNKISQYGIGMYELHGHQFRYYAAWFNVRRKTLRLERLTDTAIGGNKEAKTKLISDYKDLANYAIMAIQILEEKDDDN